MAIVESYYTVFSLLVWMSHYLWSQPIGWILCRCILLSSTFSYLLYVVGIDNKLSYAIGWDFDLFKLSYIKIFDFDQHYDIWASKGDSVIFSIWNIKFGLVEQLVGVSRTYIVFECLGEKLSFRPKREVWEHIFVIIIFLKIWQFNCHNLDSSVMALTLIHQDKSTY